MQGRLGGLVWAAMIGVGAPAVAQEPPAAPPAVTTAPPATPPAPVSARDASEWEVGLGLGYATIPTQTSETGALLTIVAGGVGSAGFIVTDILHDLPALTINAERRLAPGLWLGINLGAATSRYSQGSGDSASTDAVSYLGVGGSIRKVFNPGSPVEVSAFGAVGFTYADINVGSGSGTTATSEDINAVSVGANAGGAFEYFMTDHLSLRLITSVVELGYNTAGASSTPAGSGITPTTAAPSGFHAGVAIQPSLQLNMSF